MSEENLSCSKMTKKSRMKVRLNLNNLLVGVLLLGCAECGVIEISAYGSKQGNVESRNSSAQREEAGRALNTGNLGNLFAGMLTKPVKIESGRSRDFYGAKHIAYFGISKTEGSPRSLVDDEATSNSRSVERTGAISSDSQKDDDRHINATSFDTPKVDLSSNTLPTTWSSPTPTTVTTPISSRPLEHGTGRVKAYSYFYLSRTLWYVPLYFTLYFCLYILILVIRSIARHKVSYPNAFTSRALLDMQFITNDQAVQKADMMTTFIMKQIEEFKEKYIG